MIALEAHGLCKRFAGRSVLNQLDLAVGGGVYGLLGRNGAGKTTLLNLFLGLLLPDVGEARVLGEQLAYVPAAKRRVGYVAEGELLPGWAQIGDLIGFERALRDSWEEASLRAWLRAEDLEPTSRVNSLSKGQRKRLELELVLCARPSVLILDEPLSGLDPVARSEVLEGLLGCLAEANATAIISSHVLTDLERICDRVGILAGHRIALEVSMEELKNGGAVLVREGAMDQELPAEVRVLARRRNHRARTWVVAGLDAERRHALVRGGYAVGSGALEEMGTELIRCLDQRREQTNV